MEISIGLVQKLGFKKIYNHFKELDLDFSKISIRGELNNKESLSAFSMANSWSTTFGMYGDYMELVPSFVEWYKIYYPMVGLKQNKTDQIKVLQAGKKLKKDFEDAVSLSMGDNNWLLYAPVLEMNSLKEIIGDLSEEEYILCSFSEVVFRWLLEIQKLKKDQTRENFVNILEVLSMDMGKYLEFLKLPSDFGLDLGLEADYL